MVGIYVSCSIVSRGIGLDSDCGVMVLEDKIMKLYRELNEQEKQDFRDWARVHYKAYGEIKGIWHIVVQEECTKINREADQAG